MKRFCLLLFLALHLIVCVAQDKPRLPENYFEHFRYALPSGFTAQDSAALRREAVALAKKMNDLLDDAFQRYSIQDTAQLAELLNMRSSVYAALGEAELTIHTLELLRRVKPTPPYSLPFRFTVLGYNRAKRIAKETDSADFANALAKEFEKEIDGLDPHFRGDIINQTKGLFSPSQTDNNFKYLSRVIKQAIDNGNGQMDFMTGWALLDYYNAYSIYRKYRPLVHDLLFRLDPRVVIEEKPKIPMRDGIRLGASVYRISNATEKLPAIVSLSPYPSGLEGRQGNVFATNGYVYVYVDTRGRGASEGNFIPYEDDARDFYDIIDWVSKQPWCNGQVATSGGSYLGFTQWQAIRKAYKHPALKAINPIVAVGFGIDFPRASNTFYAYILQWASYVYSHELNTALFDDQAFWNNKAYEAYRKHIPFRQLDSVTGLPNQVFQKWVKHPNFDEYWQNILPGPTDFAQLDIPVFTITGYYDDDQNGAWWYYSNHMRFGNEIARKNHYMLIGPYEHGAAQWQPGAIQGGEVLEPAAAIPIYKYVIWWFDWVLKGKEKPSFIKGPVTYFETGNNKWSGTNSFDQLSTDSLVLYLTNNVMASRYRNDLHSLSTVLPSKEQELLYTHDIAHNVDSATIFAQPAHYSDSLYMSSKDDIVFESEPLGKDILISNRIMPVLHLKVNTPDADYFFKMYEVQPDGKSLSLAQDVLRLRYRDSDTKPTLVRPGELVTVRFSNAFIFIKKLHKGTRLRFQFGVLNSPFTERNYGFGGVVSDESAHGPRIIKSQIITGGAHASKIVIPINAP